MLASFQSSRISRPTELSDDILLNPDLLKKTKSCHMIADRSVCKTVFAEYYEITLQKEVVRPPIAQHFG